MKVKILTLLLCAVLSSVFILSCKEETTTGPNPDETQAYKDKTTAVGFVNTFWFIWNQNLAGQPAGNKDLTVNGPLGGTVHITGNTQKSDDINTIHLSYDMNGCKNSGTSYTLTFTGNINCNGTFSPTHRAMNYICSDFTYSGTVGSTTIYTVTGTCSISFAESTNQISGTICGRDFVHSW